MRWSGSALGKLLLSTVSFSFLLGELSGCSGRHDAAPDRRGTRDDSAFVNAKLAPDGRTGVVVYRKHIYHPGGIGLFFSGTPSENIIDESVVGAFDLDSRKVQVVYRHKGMLRINAYWGAKVLMEQAAGYFWLDPSSGQVTPPRGIPFAEELERQGRGAGYHEFIDDQLDAAIITMPIKDQYAGAIASQEIWVRRASGTYETVAPVPKNTVGLFRVDHGELCFYSPADRSGMRYNLRDRTSRPDKNCYARNGSSNPAIEFTGPVGMTEATIFRPPGSTPPRETIQIDTSALQ